MAPPLYPISLVMEARRLVTTIRTTPPTETQINSAFAQYEDMVLTLAAALQGRARAFSRPADRQTGAPAVRLVERDARYRRLHAQGDVPRP